MQRWCAGKEGGDDHGPVKPSDEPVFEQGTHCRHHRRCVPRQFRPHPGWKNHRVSQLFYHHSQRHDVHHPHVCHVFQGSASAARIAEVLDTPIDLKVNPAEQEKTPYHVEFRPCLLFLSEKGVQCGGYQLPPEARGNPGHHRGHRLRKIHPHVPAYAPVRRRQGRHPDSRQETGFHSHRRATHEIRRSISKRRAFCRYDL